MRQVILICFILIHSVSFAQQKNGFIQSEFTYTPVNNGIYATIKVQIKYGIFMGEPTVTAVAKVDYGDKCIRNGITYYKNDFPENVWKQIQFNTVNVEVDVYQGPNYITSKQFDNLIDFDVAGSPNWGEVFGLPAEKEKELFYGEQKFQLKNPRLINVETGGWSALNNYLKEKETEEKWTAAIQNADSYFTSGNYETAKDAYRQANQIKFSSYANEQINKCNSHIAEQKQKNQANELILEGDDLMANGDYEGAKNKYKSAILKDSENTEANQKLTEAENAIDEEKEVAQEQNESITLKSDKKSNETKDASETVTTGKSPEQQEFERQQRVIDHIQTRTKQTQERMDAASAASASFLLLHYAIAERLYKPIGKKDKEFNFRAGETYRFNFGAGYGFSVVPIFYNSSFEIYDGNNYTYDERTLNHESATLDFNAEGTFWPIYSDYFGWGPYMHIALGHGIMFQNTQYNGEFGIRSYIGFSNILMRFEFANGIRHNKYNPWLMPGELGDGGLSDIAYKKFALGPSFMFNIAWGEGEEYKLVNSTLSFMALFGKTDEEIIAYGNSPFIQNWSHGLKVQWDISHRLNINFEYMWGYKRTGDVEFGFDDDATYGGNLIRFEVLRNFDVYGKSSLHYSYAQAKKTIDSKHNWYLYVISPSVGWIQMISDTLHPSKLNIGISPIGISKDISLTHFAAIELGLQTNMNTGGTFITHAGFDTTYNSIQIPEKTTFTIEQYGVSLPVSGRLSSTLKSMNSYWVTYGFSYNYAYTKVTYETNEEFASQEKYETNISGFSSHIKRHAGFGIDFMYGENKKIRTGLLYSWGKKPLLQDFKNIYHSQIQFIIGLSL